MMNMPRESALSIMLKVATLQKFIWKKMLLEGGISDPNRNKHGEFDTIPTLSQSLISFAPNFLNATVYPTEYVTTMSQCAMYLCESKYTFYHYSTNKRSL